NVSLVLEVPDPVDRGHPDSPASILEERVGERNRFAVRFAVVGRTNRRTRILPLPQDAVRAEPDAAIARGQDRGARRIRHASPRPKGRDGNVAKTVETVPGRHPDTPFAIFEEIGDVIA